MDFLETIRLNAFVSPLIKCYDFYDNLSYINYPRSTNFRAYIGHSLNGCEPIRFGYLGKWSP
jgi:hypothetical protein